jgi:hypothetical protein
MMVKVTQTAQHGFWLLIDGTEYFLPFTEFPWFLDAPVAAILNVQRVHAMHLTWPDLDVDLELDSIRYPDRYPLRAKT